MGKAESGNSVYHQAAAAAGHKIMGPSPPPAMPSGAAYQALCDAALAESKTAREEYEAAAKDHAGDTAALVQAKLGLSLAAEPAARARAPPEKGAVEDAEAAHEESGARLAAAAVKLYETHKKATEAAGDAAVPVVKDAFQDLFPSPSPPPPPFTAGGFGLDMLNAALMGDASKGSKTLDGAAKVGMGYGMGKAESGNSVYHQAAAAAGHKIMGPSPPPAMPSGAAYQALCDAALAESKTAREEYEAAAKDHAGDTAALVQAKLGLSWAAEPAARARAPPEKGAVEDAEAAHEESGARLAAAAVKLYETHKQATEAAGDAAVPVVKDAFQDLFPSPSPPPPPAMPSGAAMEARFEAAAAEAKAAREEYEAAVRSPFLPQTTTTHKCTRTAPRRAAHTPHRHTPSPTTLS